MHSVILLNCIQIKEPINYNAYYHKWSKILNTFLFQFLNKMLVFRAGINKMLIRIANREYPDQTDFSIGPALFVKAFLAGK